MVKRFCYLAGSLLLPFVIILIAGSGVRADILQISKNTNAFSPSSTVLIDAVLYDGYEFNDADESVALRNISDMPLNLEGWLLTDGHGNHGPFPSGLRIESGAVLWIAREEEAFKRQFGHPADVILTAWPGFANNGDEVFLFDSENRVVDVLMYGSGDAQNEGWLGPRVQPYAVRGVFGGEGQILYRKLDPDDGLPVTDSNSVNDWAQDPSDPINGRKVRYPGWRLEDSFFTTQVTETAVLTVAIAPDNAFKSVIEAIAGAQEAIAIETFTFENIQIGNALAAAAGRGVDVKVLLEGSPPGGLADQEKYICRQLENSGGQCWFMISDAGERIYDRYRYLHSKFILIDNHIIAISTENLSPNSMPADDKADGTWGRRGVVIFTDAVGIADKVSELFQDDLDPQNHVDLFRWQESHPIYGAPPPGFIPLPDSGGVTYTVRYPAPSTFQGEFYFALQHAPENSLREKDGVLSIINKAGKGDSVRVQQLGERPYWGASDSNRDDDPNPRLEAYIKAAERGADVRLLLDRFFDDRDSPLSNQATCLFINKIAVEEKLNLSCQLANPTGLGIHNKMILAQVEGRGYIHVGSINGSELSNKGNRELALTVQSDDAYELLSDMFIRDTPHNLMLPLIFGYYQGPANHILISEVLYDPYGLDEGEFIEIVNPTALPIDLSGYSISDAVNQMDFEDLRRFPQGTIIVPGGLLVIATSGNYFWNEYGFWPDFEILDTVEEVPQLIDDPSWGDPGTFLRLGNSGDEVIVRDKENRIIDVIAYGDGIFPGQVACFLLTGVNHSLERYPYWVDKDNCQEDFRDWPFPNPGKKP